MYPEHRPHCVDNQDHIHLPERRGFERACVLYCVLYGGDHKLGEGDLHRRHRRRGQQDGDLRQHRPDLAVCEQNAGAQQ